MKIHKLLLLAILGCIAACKTPPFDHAYTITVQNNSASAIQYVASFNFPDTSIPGIAAQLRTIQPSNFTFLDSKDDWGKVIDNIPGHKLSLFFLSPDTIGKYGWDSVLKGYKVLVRKDLTIQEIQAASYTVAYP